MTAPRVPAKRVRDLPGNFFTEQDRAVAKRSAVGDVTVIDLSKGNPDLPTPGHIVAAMQDAVAEPRNHRYPSSIPRRSVAEAIATRYLEDHGVQIDPVREVAVFHGSHEALMAAVLSFADPGTDVVLPDPGYPLYGSAVSLAGAREVRVPLLAPDFQPDPEALDALDAASVLLLNYPHNPTGALATASTLEAAVVTARRIGALLVHDLAYSSLGFDGRRPRSVLTTRGGRGVSVEVSTVSKTYSMAGWRFGFAVGAEPHIAALRRYQAHAFSTLFGATQEAAAAALGGDQDAADELVDVYRHRRDRLVAGLRALGYRVDPPAGSFFVWLPVPGGDDREFATRLLEEVGIAVAQGRGFGDRGRGFVRLALVVDDDTIDEALRRLSGFVHTT